jgi:hypothetical protein
MNLFTSSRRAAPLVALALTACGGGGTSASAPAAPSIGPLADQTIAQGAPLSVPLAVTAAATTPGSLTVTANVADMSLVPPANVTVVDDGTARSLMLRPDPDQTGSTTVTVTVADGSGRQSSRTFRLTVHPVYAPFVAYATGSFAQSESDTPKPVSGLTFQQDADDNPAAFDAELAQ